MGAWFCTIGEACDGGARWDGLWDSLGMLQAWPCRKEALTARWRREATSDWVAEMVQEHKATYIVMTSDAGLGIIVIMEYLYASDS